MVQRDSVIAVSVYVWHCVLGQVERCERFSKGVCASVNTRENGPS